jgi:putative SOS response-associated peptidase YedK
MCGRYRRTTSEEELARLYHIPIPPQRDLPISWNIAPSQDQDVLVIRYNPKARQRRLGCATLGTDPLLGNRFEDRLQDNQRQS